MEMMEWVIIFHIFIMADIGPLWYCPPFGYCSGSLSLHCSSPWQKRALILSLFGMTMFTSYHSIRRWERDTHPSVTKMLRECRYRREVPLTLWGRQGEASSTEWLDVFLPCLLYIFTLKISLESAFGACLFIQEHIQTAMFGHYL